MNRIPKLLSQVFCLAILFLSTLSSCQNEKSSDKEKSIFLLGFLLSQSSGASSIPITCSNSTPSFSTLASAGTTSSCASCHSGGTLNAGFDVTSRSSALSRVVAGNPESSLLYQKVSSGSMRFNSTQRINEAIYCWIKGGALE